MTCVRLRRLARDEATLVVRASGRERVDLGRIKLMQSCSCGLMLVPHAGLDDSQGRDSFQYDVSGMESLRKTMGGPPVLAYTLCNMLDDVATLLNVRLGNDDGPPPCLLDPRYVFVTTDLSLRFVCLPLVSHMSSNLGSPAELLSSMCRSLRRRVSDPNYRELLSRLDEFVKCQNGAISGRRLRSFVCGERDLGGAHAQAGRMLLRELSRGSLYPLEVGRSYDLGRDAGTDISLASWPRVSRQHARLECMGEGSFLLTDRDSTNGTFFEGRRLVPNRAERVEVGQVFSLANAAFRIEAM